MTTQEPPSNLDAEQNANGSDPAETGQIRQAIAAASPEKDPEQGAPPHPQNTGRSCQIAARHCQSTSRRHTGTGSKNHSTRDSRAPKRRQGRASLHQAGGRATTAARPSQAREGPRSSPRATTRHRTGTTTRPPPHAHLGEPVSAEDLPRRRIEGLRPGSGCAPCRAPSNRMPRRHLPRASHGILLQVLRRRQHNGEGEGGANGSG